MNLDFDGSSICVLSTGHKQMNNISGRLKTPEKFAGQVNLIPNIYIPPTTLISSNNPQGGSNDSYNSSVSYHRSDPLLTAVTGL